MESQTETLATTPAGTQVIRDCVTNLLGYWKTPRSSTSPEDNFNLNQSQEFSRARRDDERKLCSELLRSLQARRPDFGSSNEGGSNSNARHSRKSKCHRDENFIRTSLNYNNKSHVITVRDVLGNLPSSTVSKLPHLLSELLTDRIDAKFLLPGTLDERANAEAMGMTSSAKSALKISQLGMLAGRIYAELIGFQGAWSAGLINVGALSGLAALVRRWGVECRGREPGSGDATRLDARQSKRRTGKKRGRMASRKGKEGDDDSDSSSSDFGEEKEETDWQHNDIEMIRGGIQLAMALSRVPQHVEFVNWSSEAREGLLDAMTCSLAICSALLAGIKSSDRNLNIPTRHWESSENLEPLCSAAVNCLSESLKTCVLKKSIGYSENSPTVETPIGGADIIDDETPKVSGKTPNRRRSGRLINALYAKEHETVVFALRGFLPIFLFQMELPNGEKGKENACETASSVLSEIIFSISNELQKDSHQYITNHRNPRTPRSRVINSSNRRVTIASTPARHQPNDTPGTAPFSNENRRNTPLPPSLKKSATPSIGRSRGLSPHFTNGIKLSGMYPHNNKPRLMLAPIIGMLQKICTSKALVRAKPRSRIASIILKCLPRFPNSPEKLHLLQFFVRLAQSRMSGHRLFAVEMIGDIFCQWLDVCNLDSSDVPEKTTTIKGRRSTFGVCFEDEEGMNNTTANHQDMFRDLLNALHGRFSDKSPAIRAKAALSLSDLLGKFARSQPEENTDLDIHEVSLSTMATTQQKINIVRESILSMMIPLTESLRRRAVSDDRALVRKSATCGLMNIILLSHSTSARDDEPPRISQNDVNIFEQNCSDPSIGTRKASAESLTLLLQEISQREGSNDHDISILISAWARSVLPLVIDMETTVVAKAVDIFQNLVINPIVEGDSEEEEDNFQRRRYETAWKVLASVSNKSNEAGAARAGSGALKVALKKGIIDTSNGYHVTKKMLVEIHKMIKLSLFLGDDDDCHTEGNVKQAGEWLLDSQLEAKRVGAWCLLDALADCSFSNSTMAKNSNSFDLSKAMKSCRVDSIFLPKSWEKLHHLISSTDTPVTSLNSLVITCRACLNVIAKLGKSIPKSAAERSANLMKRLILNFALPTDLINTASSALITLSKTIYGSGDETRIACSEWILDTFAACESVIESFISKNSRFLPTDDTISDVCNSTNLDRAVYTVGVVSMIGFSADEDKVPNSKKKDAETFSGLSVKGLRFQPSSSLVQLIQTLLPPSLPSTEISNTRMTPTGARAHAFLTLGKLCLRNETLAKASLNLFIRELQPIREGNTACPSVQSNALLVLGDLCVRYTSVVDLQLPIMASCLQSGSSLASENGNFNFLQESNGLEMVRKHAILMLSTLLLQDYIKWRGLFVQRFLVATVDEDEGVSKLAEMTLCGPLLSKQPNLFSNNFVETIFVLNGCSAHPVYAAAARTGDNGAGIAVGFEGIKLSGLYGREKRMQIFELMLSNMSDEAKIGVTARIAKEILAGALGSDGDLSAACRQPKASPFLSPNKKFTPSARRRESAMNVLTDAFAVLTSPLARVGCKKSNDTEEDEDMNPSTLNNDSSNTNRIADAKNRLLSKISRKHLIETVFPILCNLKTVLEGSHSPLLKDLMRYLVDIFRLFKNEVKEFAASDPTLLQELEYDLRQYQKNRKEEIEKDLHEGSPLA